jgi:hypothetical protein
MNLAGKKRASVIFSMISFLMSCECFAQKIDTISSFSISGYIDAYYASYSDSGKPGSFQKFPDACPRNNAPSLNIASLSCLYNADKVRAAFALNFGDIASAIFPHPYNNVLEAHVGFKIYSKLWIDAGFFRPHFGTEFILPVENITTSIAVSTVYEPSYESGVRLNFDPTKKLEINLFLLNGYNMYVNNNNEMAFGMGITYALGSSGSIGYTNYIGPPNNAPASHTRYANNVFINYQVKKIKLQAGADYCAQLYSDVATLSKTASMFSALATVKFQWTKMFGIYGRGEIFQDPDGFMSTIITDNQGNKTGYKLWGATAGIELKPTPDSYVRLENRLIQMDNNQYIFYYDGAAQNSRYEIIIDAGISFDLLKSVRTNKND